MVRFLKAATDMCKSSMYVCMVTHIARVRTNWVTLAILLVVS